MSVAGVEWIGARCVLCYRGPMKTNIAVCLCLLAWSSPGHATPPGKSLSIDLTESEKSKDSNRRTYRVEIDGARATYFGPDLATCERGRCDHRKWTVSLSAEQQARLWELVGAERLRRNFREQKSTDGLGHFVTLEVVVDNGTRRFTGHVSGRVSDPRPGQSRRQNISRAAQAYIEAAEDIVNEVRQWTSAVGKSGVE